MEFEFRRLKYIFRRLSMFIVFYEVKKMKIELNVGKYEGELEIKS